MVTTGISEIFSSIQGEGKYVGCRQLFIRLIGCNLDCRYCDTNDLAHNANVPCILEPTSGYMGDLYLKNPVDMDVILGYIRHRLAAKHHSISITGGEPLLYPDLIRYFADNLKEFNLPIFLETNGTLPQKLAKVIDYVDIISMDIKLPSDVAPRTPNEAEQRWQDHAKFLEIASAKDVYVKIVVSAESTEEDFERALAMIKNIDKDILLVLQPITPLGGAQEAPPPKMLAWQSKALEVLNNVRVIPQTHKMMNQQ